MVVALCQWLALPDASDHARDFDTRPVWTTLGHDRATLWRHQFDHYKKELNTIMQRSTKLEWLLPWANGLPGLQPVTLREFWAPGTQGPNRGMIEPALTRQGQAQLESFLDELGRAVD